ncbi:protein phosphatase 1G [Lingula anatina]|uniref:protein-serine/threonine phosphatase n=1 Tax=Lingula anatina TaxID=7574 RepID=A0A1S3H9C7_LINAN|nr:protein phosphatase 1G [Lingula anatina]|eukprot:XP_013382607.1 protein phosphatase 1G [Lingula anatina]
MGAYLSAPVTDKISVDGGKDKLKYGASSMQGWRISQEDSHNCCLDFDPESQTSLFAVYDGHGGAEVAQYCSLHLPEHIKNTVAYKENCIGQCLEDAFLSFDGLLTQEHVIEELRHIAGIDEQEDIDGEDTVEEETALLYKEATMPLEEILKKYEDKEEKENKMLNNIRKVCKKEGIQSPAVPRKKPNLTSNSDNVENLNGGISDTNDETKQNLLAKLVNGHPENENNENIEKEQIDRNNRTLQTEATSQPNRSDTSQPSSSNYKNLAQDTHPSNSGSSSFAGGSGDGAVEGSSNKSPDTEDKPGPSSSSSSAAEEPGPSGSGSSSGPSTAASSSGASGPPAVLDDSEEDSEDDEDEEENFEDEEDDSEDDEDDEDEDDKDEDDIEGAPIFMEKEEPGSDSGCTAVVALLRGNELYVANAGDSRCVVSREGSAVDMSFDHKPEDEPEKSRIEKAGGKVTADGRVNGGLNLSRAIGDHCYKRNTDLPPKEQMITALPDIKSVVLDEKDEFMVIACDGIWNFMTSQDVIDFVRDRLGKQEKISKICEELFDHCLAPHTYGDGTGCDNMTAIIVTFKDVEKVAGNKRSIQEILSEDQEQNKEKKAKTETSSEPTDACTQRAADDSKPTSSDQSSLPV